MFEPTVPPYRPVRFFRKRLHFAGVAAVALLPGCDYPTDLPALDTRWIVPAEETRFGVDELLPGSVMLTPDMTAFLVDFDPVTFQESLGTLCPLCVPANGAVINKPPFIGDFDSSVDFPSEVTSVTIVSGEILLEIQNGFNFDPLRPTAGTTGTATIAVTDDADGDLLGTLVLDGAVDALPFGSTLTRSLMLGAATIDGSILATVEVDSPLGDPVEIDTSLLLTVTATPMNVVVSSVTIDVAGRSVDLDPVDLDVEEIDEDLTDRILSGGFILDVENPFGVAADFQLTVDGPTITPIQKSASVPPTAASTIEIAFTTGELQSFLGEAGVVLTGGAVVDPAAGQITVTAGQELVLTGKLDLTLRIGG